MRLHSIFQEKKLLWSALLPDAPNACLGQLPQEGLQSRLELIQTKDKTSNSEQKNLHITQHVVNTGDKSCSDRGAQTKKLVKQPPFSNFFTVVCNSFLLNREANKAKLQNAGSMGEAQKRLVFATLVPTVNQEMAPLLFTTDEIRYGKLFITKGQIQEVSNPTAQILLVFSSFEKSDLNNALNLFQKYLTSLTNRLTALKDFKTNVKSRDFDLLGQGQKVAGILRAARDLNQPFKSNDIPLSTQLYTVIRSPHVFKKTREQFAITKAKRTIKLNFKSKAALRLLVDSLILLKLPAEVKVILRDY